MTILLFDIQRYLLYSVEVELFSTKQDCIIHLEIKFIHVSIFYISMKFLDPNWNLFSKSR